MKELAGWNQRILSSYSRYDEYANGRSGRQVGVSLAQIKNEQQV